MKSPFSRKNPLERLSLSQLREEEKTLELQANRTYRALETLLQKKHTLFMDGVGQDRLKKELLALKIQELDVTARLKVKMFQSITRRRSFISNLVVLKEAQNELRATPIWNKLQQLSPDELERALVRVELRDSTLDDLVSRLNEVFEASAESVHESTNSQNPIMVAWSKMEEGNIAADLDGVFDFDTELAKLTSEVTSA